MPPIEINDPESIAKVTIYVSASSSAFIAEMSFSHYLIGATGLTPDQVATNIETPLAALLGAGSTDGIRNVLSTSTTIIRTEVSKPLVEPQPVVDETTRALAGGLSGGLAPPDLAMVVSFRTDTSGPAFRGRSYVAGIGVGAILSTGLYSTTLTNALAADWQTYIAALPGLTTEMSQVTLSRFENVGGVPVPRDPPLAATVLTATVDAHADTQRRRGVR